MWAEEYRPSSLDDFRGSSKTVQEVKGWVENWDDGEGALLLHGPPGVGKTSLVHALANEMDMEVFETNASDARTRKSIEGGLKKAVKQRSFTGKRKIILVDEVDGLGRADRGGKKMINSLVKESRFPVILTANDSYASGMRTFRNSSKVVELGNVHTNSIAARLREICEKEGLEYEREALKAIAHRADGDMRSAINDLQSLAGDGTIDEEDVKNLDYRETEREIFETLKIIFKTTSASTASTATDGLDETYDDLFEWIRENIPREYKRGRDVSRAFDRLSRADVFRGRMVQNQDWILMKYMYDMMTVGIALSKDEKYEGFTRYSYPSRIKKMGRSRSSRKKRDSIASKIADSLHVSTSEATEMIFFLRMFLEKPEWRDSIVSELDLEEKEIEFIEDF